MKAEHIYKKFQDYQKVLEREAKTLTGLAIRVKLIVGMDSYATADNRTIQIGLYPWEAAFNWEIVKRIIRFKFHHEIQHVLSTDSEEFSSAIMDVADELKTAGVCSKRAVELGKWLVNGTEDGRIENLMVILRKGLKKLRDWYRLKEYETTEVAANEDMSNIELALLNIHSVACRGYLCKGFATHYTGEKVYEVVMDCLENIKKAVTATTTRGMCDECREMAEKLIVLIDKKQEEELGETLSEKAEQEVIFVSNKNIENLDKGDKWKEKLNKNSKIVAILEDTDEDEKPNGDSDEDAIVPDEIIDLRTKKPEKEDNDEESKSSAKGGSGNESEGDEQKGSNGTSSSKEDAEESDTESNGSGSDSSTDSGNDEGTDGNGSESSPEGEKTDLGTEGSQNSTGSNQGNSEGNSEGGSNGNGKSKPSVDEFLEKKLDDLEESLEKADKLQDEMENKEKSRKLQIIKEIQQNGVAERDRNKPDMKNIMLDVEKRQDAYSMPRYYPYGKDKWRTVDAPYEVIAKAAGIREDVKKALASETEQTIGGLYEGDFDIDNIANLCLGSFDCFKKESTHKDEVHFDITILKDNSGSMGGKINERCCTAMALLEEIVKGINGISLKIADYSNIKHGIIKDWDDMSGEFNYSWSYYENETVDGGQYDDVSMDLFTSELVARPAATNKMLCILTDGEPCVPREALQEILSRGRQNGVYIMVFFIGYDAERIANNKERYEDIYGEGCCFAIPFSEDMMNLGDVFVELLRANVKF